MSIPMGEIIPVRGLSNSDFFARHAAAGRVGLVAGTSWADRLIARAERHLNEDKSWGSWTHAFVCQGQRLDGRHWVVESDLDVHRKHTRLGVQENRVDKYHDEETYSTLALVDFGLGEEQLRTLVEEALELVATRATYSIRELLGTVIAMKRPQLRGEENRMARDHSFYCSAFVQHVFRRAGVDLFPGVDVKNTTPDDLGRSPLPFRMWVLERARPQPLVKQVAGRVRKSLEVRRRARRIARGSAKA